MKTFNIDLWQKLKNIYNTKENSYLKPDTIFFGIAKENQPAPYCVIHVMNCGTDIGSQTLCKKDEGYNKIGVSNIQFTMYATNDMVVDELLQELNDVLDSLTNLEEYRILQSIRRTTKNASSFTNELGAGLTRYDFQYERL